MVEEARNAALDSWRPDYGPCIVNDILAPAVCEQIIEIAERAGFERSLVYDSEDGSPADEQKIRRSEASAITATEHREFYTVMADVIRRFNAARYRFAIKGLDPLQVIRYETGAFFQEHTDIGVAGAAHRKVSLILQLSDPKNYDGGDLVLNNRQVVPREQGSGCIFPSWVPHEVRPVTRGLRYSLVTWALGDYFL